MLSYTFKQRAKFRGTGGICVGRLAINHPIPGNEKSREQQGVVWNESSPSASGWDERLSIVGKEIFRKISFGWWPVSNFLSGKWQCDWFVKTCGFLLTSATNWVLWSQRCLPPASFRSMLTQSLMCIAVPAPPLSSSAWWNHQMSPTCFNSSLLFSSLSSLFMHCWTKCTLLIVPQPPHGPTGSLTHLVVQLVFVQLSVQVWCRNGQVSPFLSPLPHSPSPSSPHRNEGTPAHPCRWPGRPHRASEGQRRPALLPGVRGKSQSWLCFSVSLSSKHTNVFYCNRVWGSFMFMPLWSHMHVF